MKNNILLIILVATLLTGPWSLALAAPGDLVVEFESTPLFQSANFLPGEAITRFIKVTNNTSESKIIAIEAINETDPDGLATQLVFTIKEGVATRYSGTLADFFTTGETALSSLAGNGTQTQYDFTLDFGEDAANEYQGKTLGFDLLVGFQGEATSSPQPPLAPQGNGGGAGGAVQGLSIQNEGTFEIGETSVLVSWFTSYNSTSRVVYGTSSGLFDFDNPPNYGYPFSTAESNSPANPNGVTFHQVSLTGLTPGTTYYYRTISHASPDTVSVEKTFTTKKSQITPSGPFSEQASPQPQSVQNEQLQGGTVVAAVSSQATQGAGSTGFTQAVGNQPPSPSSQIVGEPSRPSDESLQVTTSEGDQKFTPSASVGTEGLLGAFLGRTFSNMAPWIFVVIILIVLIGLRTYYAWARQKR